MICLVFVTGMGDLSQMRIDEIGRLFYSLTIIRTCREMVCSTCVHKPAEIHWVLKV